MGNLPASIRDINRLLALVETEGLRDETRRQLSAKICIAGPVNSGKSTLFNLLKDQTISATSHVPGTTKQVVVERIGPFILLDTPGLEEVHGGDRADLAWDTLATADVVVLVMDASAGVRRADKDLVEAVDAQGKRCVVALNKIDLVGSEADVVALDAETKLGRRVVPISAKQGTNVTTRLVPEMIALQPDIALLIGRELPAFRHHAAGRIIREAVLLNTAAGTEPVPMLDLPLLLATQIRMVIRLAALHGEEMSVAHAKELISAIAGGLALRYLAQQGAKLLPSFGWAIAGGISGAGTYAIGRVTERYFESGKKITPPEMRKLYKALLRQAEK